MKKIAALIFLAGFFIKGFALIKVGVIAGTDIVSVPGKDLGATDVDGIPFTSFKRDTIHGPFLVGLNGEIGVPFLFDIEFTADYAQTSYIVSYDAVTTEVPFYKRETDTLPFKRAGIYVTLRKDLISFPPLVSLVHLHFGAGAQLALISPVVSEKFVSDLITKKVNNFDLSTEVHVNAAPGIHLMLGTRIAPPLLPLSFSLNYRVAMYAPPVGKYDEPNIIPSLYAGMSFGF